MFFPLKDYNPTQRFPFVTIALIAINVVVFAYELMLGREASVFIASWGAIPFEITQMTDLVGRVEGSPLYHEPGPGFPPATLLTSMFMHGGFMHIIGNMLYLWIFGNNVEDLMGSLRFLLFYLGCGLLASFSHIAVDPGSTIPTIGASGAVAGVLGAYLIAWPRARVLTLVFIVIFIRTMVLPAGLLLVFWFLIQFMQGFMSIAGTAGGGVAWFAHIGGFIAGVVGVFVFAGPQLRALREARRMRDTARFE